jgi:transcriptional regulator with XRE-family HTH domain
MSKRDKTEQHIASEEIATKVNYLFSTYRNSRGERYSYTDVERLTNGEIANSWVSKLAAGKASRPGLTVLKTLTNFFGVTPDFWFKDLDEWIQEEKVNKELQAQSLNEGIQQIAFSSQGLEPEDIETVRNVIEAFREKNKNLGRSNKTGYETIQGTE